MKKCHVKLTKRLGQHLLVDKGYLRKVIENSELDTVDQVLEVGPGTGNLTELLVEKTPNLIAVELDRRFCQLLTSEFRGKIQLVEDDILVKGSFNPLVAGMLRKKWALVANLPYNVASVVMVDALYLDNPPQFMCVTIQKEVAQRMASKPNCKSYGVLSALVQALSEVKIISYVPPGAFLPPPRVHSAIVKITWRPELAGRIKSREDFRVLVSRLFRHRRKTLRGGWVRMLEEGQQKQADKALGELGIDSGRRPETLCVSEFIELSNKIF
ncbi:MAG: 16S rRNA (adenine(1518)-N(6)/adenine(1519)-N(6))-dimethyltransferase RsmA [Phycisphaerae bacterium]